MSEEETSTDINCSSTEKKVIFVFTVSLPYVMELLWIAKSTWQKFCHCHFFSSISNFSGKDLAAIALGGHKTSCVYSNLAVISHIVAIKAQ